MFGVGWGWVSGGVDPTDAGSECDKIGARRCLSWSVENQTVHCRGVARRAEVRERKVENE
jgi:hypothetical protein